LPSPRSTHRSSATPSGSASSTRCSPTSRRRRRATVSIWLASLNPIAEVSGLAATSLRLELSIRIYENFKSQPEDEIDKRLLDATSKLMEAYTGDFQLGGTVMDVDLLGAHGDPLGAEGGYLSQDSSLFRVVVMTLPIIISDVYTQTA
jgi:hypothetical protein